jgi:hypothetical protein
MRARTSTIIRSAALMFGGVGLSSSGSRMRSPFQVKLTRM